jgi:hypothetical protein
MDNVRLALLVTAMVAVTALWADSFSFVRVAVVLTLDEERWHCDAFVASLTKHVGVRSALKRWPLSRLTWTEVDGKCSGQQTDICRELFVTQIHNEEGT